MIRVVLVRRELYDAVESLCRETRGRRGNDAGGGETELGTLHGSGCSSEFARPEWAGDEFPHVRAANRSRQSGAGRCRTRVVLKHDESQNRSPIACHGAPFSPAGLVIA